MCSIKFLLPTIKNKKKKKWRNSFYHAHFVHYTFIYILYEMNVLYWSKSWSICNISVTFTRFSLLCSHFCFVVVAFDFSCFTIYESFAFNSMQAKLLLKAFAIRSTYSPFLYYSVLYYISVWFSYFSTLSYFYVVEKYSCTHNNVKLGK